MTKKISGLTNKAIPAGTDQLELESAGSTFRTPVSAFYARAQHTGTQLASTVSDFNAAVQTNALDTMAATTDITTRDATGAAHGLMPKLDKTKLDGVASGATANATDAALRARSSHTGTQSATTIGSGDLALARMTLKKEVIMLALTKDPATAVTVGTKKVSFRLPFAFTLTEVIVSADFHGTSSTMTIDVNDDGVSINGTPLSLTTTQLVNQAASTQAFADNSVVTVDVDAAGTDVRGVVVYLIGKQV